MDFNRILNSNPDDAVGVVVASHQATRLEYLPNDTGVEDADIKVDVSPVVAMEIAAALPNEVQKPQRAKKPMQLTL
eukprot:7818576-Ditylum_brightwellii.AAC.1